MEKAKGSTPDLIIRDISMPEKSGVRFYREIEERGGLPQNPGGPHTGPAADAFIAKPIHREQLLKVVRALLVKWS